jgi:hypothetical protein
MHSLLQSRDASSLPWRLGSEQDIKNGASGDLQLVIKAIKQELNTIPLAI